MAFADRRRSSLSDGSRHSSNVVRKSKSSAHHNDHMTSADRKSNRRPSDGSHSHQKQQDAPIARKGQALRRKSSSGSYTSLSRRGRGAPSRKQTLPITINVDPVATNKPGKNKADLQSDKITSRSKGESRDRNNKKNPARPSSTTKRRNSPPTDDVLVDFPERPRRNGSRRSIGEETKEILGISGIFKKSEGNPQESNTSRANPTSKKQHLQQTSMRSTYATSKSSRNPHARNRGHTREFEDTVNWRNTSIDWGDDTDDESSSADNGSTDHQYQRGARRDPSGHNKQRMHSSFYNSFHNISSRSNNMDMNVSSTSLTASLTSLLSLRKLEP